MNVLMALVVFTLLAGGNGYTDLASQQDSRDFIQQADIHAAEGQYDLALKYLDEAVAMKDGFLDLAHDNRGMVYLKMDFFKSALEDFDKAIELNPADSFYYSHRGQLYSDMGQLDNALQDYTRAIDLDSKTSIAYLGRHQVYLKQNKSKEAAADLSIVKKLDIGLADEIIRGAQELEKAGRFDKAADYARCALEINPKLKRKHGKYIKQLTRLSGWQKQNNLRLQQQVYDELLEARGIRFLNEGWRVMQDHLREFKDDDSEMNTLDKEARKFKEKDIYQVHKNERQMAIVVLRIDEKGILNRYVYYFSKDNDGQYGYVESSAYNSVSSDIKNIRASFTEAAETDLIQDADGDGWWDELARF